jgi:hypothetical protein
LTQKYWKGLPPAEVSVAVRHFLVKPLAELEKGIGAVEALTQPSGCAAEIDPKAQAELIEEWKPHWPDLFPPETLMTAFRRGRATAATLGKLVEESAHLLALTFAYVVRWCATTPLATHSPEPIQRCEEIRALLDRELGKLNDGDLQRVRVEMRMERDAATEPGDPAAEAPVIWYHGERAYSADGRNPVVVPNEQHNALQAFLKRGVALDTQALTKVGINNVAKVMTAIGATFRGTVRKPEKKGQGYFVRVQAVTTKG